MPDLKMYYITLLMTLPVVFSFPSSPQKKDETRNCFETSQCLPCTRSTTSVSQREKCSIAWLTPHCLTECCLWFPIMFVFHTWTEVGQDGIFLIQGQTGIKAWRDQKENKTCLDHNRKCYLLHIFTLKPLNVFYKVQNQDNIDLSAWINCETFWLIGSLKVVLTDPFFSTQCFQVWVLSSQHVIIWRKFAVKWC